MALRFWLVLQQGVCFSVDVVIVAYMIEESLESYYLSKCGMIQDFWLTTATTFCIVGNLISNRSNTHRTRWGVEFLILLEQIGNLLLCCCPFLHASYSVFPHLFAGSCGCRGHQEADMLCIGSNQANQRGIGPRGAREVAGRLQPGHSRCKGTNNFPFLSGKQSINPSHMPCMHLMELSYLFCFI